jgi:hypothetical protein
MDAEQDTLVRVAALGACGGREQGGTERDQPDPPRNPVIPRERAK